MKQIVRYLYLMVISVLFLIFYLDLPYSQELLSLLLLIPLCFLVCHFFLFSSRMSTKYLYLSHSNLFLLGYVIVFYQCFVDLFCGIVTLDNEVFISKGVIIPTIILADIGLIAFLLGFSIECRQRLNFRENSQYNNTFAYPFLLSIFVAVLCVFFLNIDRAYIIGSYGREDLKNSLAVRCEIIINLLIYALVIIKICILKKMQTQCTFKKYSQAYGVLFYICWLGYLAYVLVSGDRGPLITSLLAYFVGFLFLSNYRMKFITLFFCILIGSSFISFLGFYRKTDPLLDDAIRIQESLSLREYRDESVSPETRELAGSINTLCASVFYVPKDYPYTYGLSNISQILCSVPFMSGLIANVLPQEYENRVYSADFITYLIQGPNNTYGNGTSCIADIYLDLGSWGVAVLMFGWGVLIRRIEFLTFMVKHLSLLGLSTTIVIFSNAIYISRSSMAMTIRDVFWVWLILLITFFLCKLFKRRKI